MAACWPGMGHALAGPGGPWRQAFDAPQQGTAGTSPRGPHKPQASPLSSWRPKGQPVSSMQ
jgi:hypothetical protein